MRIATWNINGMKARLDYMGHWLRAVSPDVVGLQELKMTDADFPHAAFEALGYRAVTHGQKSWNGVAVLTKVTLPEPIVRTRGLPGQEANGARLISVSVEGLTFIDIYCPNGKTVEHEDFQMKLAWFRALETFVQAELTASPSVVLTGDFNIVPAAIDSWNEEKLKGSIFHTPEERARIDALLALGLHDVYRAKHPDEPGHTWWDYRAGAFHKRQGLRIDLILASAKVLERVRSVELSRDWRKKVEGLVPSDHTPVWADLA